ncbi:MAG: sterol desaturase family protein [Vicinamibacterales bacterium]
MTDIQTRRRYYFSHHTVQVMGLLAIAGLALAVRRGDAAAAGMFAVGWGVYVVEEYLVHRFIFHAPAPRQQWLFDVLYRLHYGHHDQVANRYLLFTPLWFALSLTIVNAAFVAVFVPLELVIIGAFGGGVTAYLLFEWLHLASHFRYPDKGRLARHITRRHARHHHVDYAYWYTVSPGGGLVDTALGSDPANRAVVPHVNTCGIDPQDPRFVRSRARYGTDVSLANGAPVHTRTSAAQAS